MITLAHIPVAWPLKNTLYNTDVVFCEKPSLHLRIMFKDGKNDFYSEGAERIVAARLGRGAYCPVEFTQNYFCFLGSGYNGYLVPSCLPNARPNPLKNLLYPAALEDLRRLLTDLGHDSRLYGEHSGKRGGATSAVENGMDMETLQRFGRWRSPSVPAKYVDLGTSARIAMSKVLQKKF